MTCIKRFCSFESGCFTQVLLYISEKVQQTVKIDASSVEIEERGVKLRLTVVDTPGFGDSLNSVEWYVFSALDKLCGQLGIYATWLSSIAYLQKQLRIFYIFYATFLAVITYVFLLNEAIMNVPTYILSLSALLSIKLEDFCCT